MSTTPTWFQRFLLPGLAFKAVVIGGGYATGRELAEFFLPSGPQGGVMAMALATLIWSLVCAVTFLFAHATRAYDYRSFFQHLLGHFWGVFELAYVLFMVLILAVFGAAAGAIVAAATGWPELAGTLLLMVCIGAFTAFGNQSGAPPDFGAGSALAVLIFLFIAVVAGALTFRMRRREIEL